jgi:hypothetical protein
MAFGRSFPMELLCDRVLQENSWFCDLLSCWSPSGDQDQDGEPHRLRLAIRDGYINFYRAGQSVSEVRFDKGRLRAKNTQ